MVEIVKGGEDVELGPGERIAKFAVNHRDGPVSLYSIVGPGIDVEGGRGTPQEDLHFSWPKLDDEQLLFVEDVDLMKRCIGESEFKRMVAKYPERKLKRILKFLPTYNFGPEVPPIYSVGHFIALLEFLERARTVRRVIQ